MAREGKRSRGPHKPGCQCVICRRKREKVAREATVAKARMPTKPSLVRLGTLNAASLFELNGERYRVGEKTPECVVCSQLRYQDFGPLPTDKGWRVSKTVTLGILTMVMPIK